MRREDARAAPAEQLFADLDTAAIALRLMGAEHPRLKLDLIAARVSAHAREVLSGAVRIDPQAGGAESAPPHGRCATGSPQEGEIS